MAGAAGRRGFGRRVGRLVASGGGLDEHFPVVNERIFDTTTLSCPMDWGGPRVRRPAIKALVLVGKTTIDQTEISGLYKEQTNKPYQ